MSREIFREPPAPRRPLPTERPWWWPSSWDMGRAWQVWAMLMISWGVLCWLHGPEAMAKAAWQACPWCDETQMAPEGAAAWGGVGLFDFVGKLGADALAGHFAVSSSLRAKPLRQPGGKLVSGMPGAAAAVFRDPAIVPSGAAYGAAIPCERSVYFHRLSAAVVATRQRLTHHALENAGRP